VHLLGTGRLRADERAFTCNQIGVAETRQANAKEMELSPAAQVEGLDSTLSDTYATPSRCMAVVVGISAFTLLLELVWRELFRRWTVSGPQWIRTGLWLQRAWTRMAGTMLGANVEYYQIDNLKLTTLA
jgi:hypothetical protein